MSLLDRFDPPGFLSDFDAILGQLAAWHQVVSAAAAENRVRRALLFSTNLQQVALEIAAQRIVPAGGEYLFVPSMTALRSVLASP